MKQSEIIKIVKPILVQQGATKAALFGSVARGDAGKDSDIDLLIEPSKDTSLLDLAHLKGELERILKNKVDLITYNSIHPLLKKRILKDQKVIYEKRS